VSDFYTSIAPWYDRIFPVDPETADFLAAGLPPCARALDLACGTGGYAKALAGRGLAVEACDLDAAMVGLALASPVERAAFRSLDMRDAPIAFRDRRFALAYCIGNSLVHRRPVVDALLAGLRPLLARLSHPGRRELRRILDEGCASRPSAVGLSFVRDYRLEGGIVRRDDALDGGGGATGSPLRRTRSTGRFAQQGSDGRLGSDYGEPWTPDRPMPRARIGPVA
jgi:SAM-dependent methyltransferase